MLDRTKAIKRVGAAGGVVLIELEDMSTIQLSTKDTMERVNAMFQAGLVGDREQDIAESLVRAANEALKQKCGEGYPPEKLEMLFALIRPNTISNEDKILPQK
jgi:hypothetical protein